MKTPDLSGYWPANTTDIDRLLYTIHLWKNTSIWRIQTRKNLLKSIEAQFASIVNR